MKVLREKRTQKIINSHWTRVVLLERECEEERKRERERVRSEFKEGGAGSKWQSPVLPCVHRLLQLSTELCCPRGPETNRFASLSLFLSPHFLFTHSLAVWEEVQLSRTKRQEQGRERERRESERVRHETCFFPLPLVTVETTLLTFFGSVTEIQNLNPCSLRV